MGDLHAINAQSLTPRIVVENFLKEEAHKCSEVYIIGFYEQDAIGEDGINNVTFASGDLRTLALAALLLQQMALQYSNGHVSREDFDDV